MSETPAIYSSTQVNMHPGAYGPRAEQLRAAGITSGRYTVVFRQSDQRIVRYRPSNGGAWVNMADGSAATSPWPQHDPLPPDAFPLDVFSQHKARIGIGAVLIVVLVVLAAWLVVRK